jgi:radical SAM superfamily enzyme YgiQ (UPF0313 family)
MNLVQINESGKESNIDVSGNVVLVCHKYSVPLNDPCCYPLGFMYVSSLLKERGCNVKVLNYNLWEYDLREELKNQDFALFTGFEEFKGNIIRDAVICKELGVKTVLGGALATFCFNEMSKYVDYVFTEEIDSSITIDKISFPDYDGFEVREYHKRNNLRHVGILTSRGCPYACTFCSQICKFRMRSLDNVFQEIDLHVKKYAAELVVFNDNTFNLNKSRFLKICKEMKDRSLAWGASIRCDIFDEDMAVAAKNSGCQGFVVGVESFIQERLAMMNKQVKVEDIYRTLDLLNKYSIKYKGNILLGFENESYQDIAEEVSSIPEKYSVTPVLVQHFIGTSNGVKRLISTDEVKFLNQVFEEYVNSKGLYLYPF